MSRQHDSHPYSPAIEEWDCPICRINKTGPDKELFAHIKTKAHLRRTRAHFMSKVRAAIRDLHRFEDTHKLPRTPVL